MDSNVMDSSRVSCQFNTEDADIHFKSSDNVLFFIHRESLKYSAAAFPPVEFEAIKDEIVPLTETSNTLELLFAFLYPNPLPDVKGLPFETLSNLAEAAEKYQVFSAMMICNMRMMVVVNDHPVGVLRYAIMHNYKELLDIAAPLVIGLPLPDMIVHLPPNTIPAWIKYYQQWLDGLTKVYKIPSHRSESCCDWDHSCARAMKELGGRAVSLRKLELILVCARSDDIEKCCRSSMQAWLSKSLEIVNSFCPFSAFLYPNSSS